MMMMRLEMLTEEFEEQTSSVVKRKRTKRPRPSSSSSSGISSTDQEDEDMANCLILLARGNSPPPENKTGSRKFAEMSTTAGKVGIYVYECKTCSRTFPSFQALGGHRASHKRPKLAAAAADTDQKRSPPPAGADDRENGEKAVICHVKIHECSICGSEFASGQALGGHMRRHRAVAAAATAVNDVSVKHRNMLALDLDLNLPAPPEDVGKFSQFSAKATFFSAAATAALVDCHY